MNILGLYFDKVFIYLNKSKKKKVYLIINTVFVFKYSCLLVSLLIRSSVRPSVLPLARSFFRSLVRSIDGLSGDFGKGGIKEI